MKFSTYIMIAILLSFTNLMNGQNFIVQQVETECPYTNVDLLKNKIESQIRYNGELPLFLECTLTDGEKHEIMGTEKRQVQTAYLSITIFNVTDNTKVATKDFKLSSSGETQREAYKKLPNSIRQKSKSIVSWMNKSVEDIEPVTCAKLKSAATQHLLSKQYTEAYELTTFNVKDCSEELSELSHKIFRAYQKAECQNILAAAKSYLSIDDFRSAAREIIRIDPEANCGEEIQAVIDAIGDNYDEEKDEKYQLYLQYLKTKEKDFEQRRAFYESILLKN